jgi:uncharacterized membrane protein
MEICILKFEGSRDAEDALNEVIEAQADRNAWLHDIGVIARPLVGRVRVGATFPDGKSKTFHEGDLADAVADLGAYTGYFVSALAGPLGSLIGSVNAATAAGAQGGALEARLFHLDELKKALPRDSSALVLIAQPDTCDQMVELFESYEPKVIRRDVADELRKRLDALHGRLEKQFQAEQEGAPATH